MKTETWQQWLNVVIVVVVLALLGGTAWFYFSRYDRLNHANVEAFIRDFGSWAPLIWAVLYVIASPVPFVAPLLTAVGGLLFGAIWGTLYTLVVAAISSLVPFFLARRLGRDWVESQVEGKKLDEYYQQSAGSKGFTFILLMRLIPVLPFEVQNYVAGLTQVTVPTFILATMLGIIPGSFSLAFLGDAAMDPMSVKFYIAVALKVVTALIPVVATYVRSRREKQQEENMAGMEGGGRT